MKLEKHTTFGIIMIALSIVVVCIGAYVFGRQYEKDPVVLGPGVTRVTMLSEWFSDLEGTEGDTEVYIMDSGVEGGKFLIYGGTHADEIAGIMACYLVIENVIPEQGCLYVIPHANNSALTNTEPGKGAPDRVWIELDDGTYRWFRTGSRATNPVHQWPDPEMFVHYPSGQFLAADEARNFNRVHPGKKDGTLTQKVAYGFNQLIIKEGIDMNLDQHEAPPEKPLVDAVCAHQRAIDLITAVSVLDFEPATGINLRIEASPENLHGFSHREIGDHTQSLAVLSEVVNPLQGAVHGAIDWTVAVYGQDKFYDRLLETEALKVKWNEAGTFETGDLNHNVTGGEPLAFRTGRNLEVIAGMINELGFLEGYEDKAIVVSGLPTLNDLLENGIGHYLHTCDGVVANGGDYK